MTHHDDEDGHYGGMVGAFIAFAWFAWHLSIYWQPQKDATWKCCFCCDKNTRIKNNVTKLWCGWLSCYTWCGATIVAMTVLEICAGCLKLCKFIDDWSLEHALERQETYLNADHYYVAPSSQSMERGVAKLESGIDTQKNPMSHGRPASDGGKKAPIRISSGQSFEVITNEGTFTLVTGLRM